MLDFVQKLYQMLDFFTIYYTPGIQSMREYGRFPISSNTLIIRTPLIVLKSPLEICSISLNSPLGFKTDFQIVQTHENLILINPLIYLINRFTHSFLWLLNCTCISLKSATKTGIFYTKKCLRKFGPVL